jgi:hypothetical protein
VSLRCAREGDITAYGDFVRSSPHQSA